MGGPGIACRGPFSCTMKIGFTVLLAATAWALSPANSEQARAAPDLSGWWEGPGFDLAPPEDGGPGPVTNISKDIQKPEGDYRNPLLKPWAAAIVKHWAEE